MQSILRHPNITLLMGVIPQIPNIYIVFELCDYGSLYDLLHLRQNVELPNKDRIRIARDVAQTFLYIHKQGIVHRDIKSHNVLIDHNLTVKVCDFGLAKFNVSAQAADFVGRSWQGIDVVCGHTDLYGG